MKYFTPQEATQTLPLVRKIVADILAAGQSMRDISLKVGRNAEKDPGVVQLMGRLEELFEELEELGCSYKDWNFSAGLVDFPAKIGDEEVLLCWRSDEDSLKYYHEIESGFAARKLIPKKYLS
ncbi:MAG: DUF2203 domain-containing protein [Candidatus Omnitrophica bacterium]|nr:DUF2203 domain-containing protein [Candidatus Omnitrophota bacterium]